MKSFHFAFAVLLALAAFFIVPAGAAAPADLAGTSWSMLGKMSVSAGSFGKISGQGYVYLDFRSDGSFSLYDEGDYGFEGDYDVDAKGNLTLAIAAEEIENFIYENLGGFEDYIEDLAVTKVTIKGKATQTNEAANLSFSLKMNYQFTFYDDESEKERTIKASYSLTAKGTINIAADRPGSSWLVQAAENIKVKKQSDSQNLSLTLITGPNETYDLAFDEFAFYRGSAFYFGGTYYRQKNKITFLPANLNEFLADAVAEFLDEAEVTGSVPAFSAAVKDQVSIKLNGKVNFWAGYEIYDEDQEEYDYIDAKGIYSLVGTGAPLP